MNHTFFVNIRIKWVVSITNTSQATQFFLLNSTYWHLWSLNYQTNIRNTSTSVVIGREVRSPFDVKRRQFTMTFHQNKHCPIHLQGDFPPILVSYAGGHKSVWFEGRTKLRSKRTETNYFGSVLFGLLCINNFGNFSFIFTKILDFSPKFVLFC